MDQVIRGSGVGLAGRVPWMELSLVLTLGPRAAQHFGSLEVTLEDPMLWTAGCSIKYF